MGWWRRWFGRTLTPAEMARATWRQAWAAAKADGGDSPASIASLRQQLENLGLPEEEIELEREMLEGLEAVRQLRSGMENGELPRADTGHRVIGTEPCHFTAIAFAPDEPDHPAGRLLFTPTRAVFVGGGRTLTIPWHSILEVHESDRDVLLVRVDRERLFRFRCNTFADAMSAATLARRLTPRRGRPL